MTCWGKVAVERCELCVEQAQETIQELLAVWVMWLWIQQSWFYFFLQHLEPIYGFQQ